MRASEKCEVIFDLDPKRKKIQQLEQQAGDPDFWNDQNRARKVIAETNQLKGVVEPFDELHALYEDMTVMLELAEEEDRESRESLAEELSQQLVEFEKKFRKVEVKSLLGDPIDVNNAYLSLNAGAGGTESCDWADMLYRMYLRYAESHGFEVSTLDFQPGDEAGLKNVTILISGPYAFGYLKAERGVHRLVRISPFDSNSRRHTSFAAVDIVAEIDEDIEIDIQESDLRIDTFRASGAGGQHVNTTDSAVRITHLPSGIITQCQAERSQHNNRTKAMNMLRAKLYELEMDKKRKDMEKFYGDKGEIAWGHQIRSYVMQPYTMVKDHRTDIDKGNVQGVLDGDLDEFIEGYLKLRKQ